MNRRNKLWVALMAISLMTPAWAAPKTFYVGDPAKRDVVTFTSDAPLEMITGQSNRINGKVTFDDQFLFDAKHPFDIEFKVDLGSMNTGIPLRDDHMRDNYLETDKFPNAVFKVTGIQAKSAKAPTYKNLEVVNLVSTGRFTLHGKTTQKTIPLKVTYIPESTQTHNRFRAGNLIRIQGEFPVTLKAHDVKAPAIFSQKLAETVMVKIDVFGTDNPKALE